MQTPSTRPSLEHFPITLFTVVMGLGGLTIATERVEAFFSLPTYASLVLLVVTALVWLSITVTYLLKCVRFPAAVVAEVRHPIRLSFFPASSIGLMLIATAVFPYLPAVTQLLWWISVVAQLAFTLMVLNFWIHAEHFTTEHNSPAWFIPIVANLLVPLAGAPLGYVEISYFFFAIGIVFWLPLMAISLNRSFFFAPVPAKLRPTLFILIVPPAIGFSAWTALHAGVLDDFGRVLYFVGLFMTLMVMSQWKKFARLPFALTWWAFSFPIASISIASFLYYSLVHEVFFAILALSFFVVLAVVVVMLSIRTAILVIRKGALLPEG